MSKKFLTKLAGGVLLGSAALLLSAPAAALASSDGEYGDSRAKDRNGFVCATNEQLNELIAANIISDNDIEDSEVTFEQSVAVDATNENRTQPNTVIVCIRDIDVDVDVED
ncbi:hypothetical protein DER29_5810 [Micromonospora sp. M71_S20]|uniref:hypothetical protein n=1 Tax=Micromonospora sp. M71_S20 TaxID=592872 RepID=UPI000EB09CC7|nr:hypothetical protein [Micromonospora sp. M71_S20]RLK12529.1 hypothetical protein DER29_5810 [Micromonospora sp. M71_S20]